MLCADCQKDFKLTELIFKEDGMVPGLIMTRYKALCRDCSKKVPIDDNVTREIAPEYPF